MTELATGSATSGEATRTALYTCNSGGSGGVGEASESGKFYTCGRDFGRTSTGIHSSSVATATENVSSVALQ